ncbi:MAG TPA: hypothetical protein EYN28_07710 [Flavobacteriales bacterium]|jgi:hypothetical protein|nr:hypothetical protein [Flavobacteriales bacterium]HIB76278.1 hypothetical protein [Flavobacteriales bacterium]HIN41269.1 hypothetical protein [Flavobacteriales bacterium]HIO16737.1 hypothetical protein [Flavobacteriales bacterium]HIO60046.1 hypothetical protein [Flavobacteriales bacterium]
MKTNNKIQTLGIAVFAITIGLAGCKGSQAITPSQNGEIEIIEYCTGSEFNSDSKHFRATATGESLSRETAKKMSRSNAENRLARTISATLAVVTDNYVNSTKFNNKEEVTETFNDLARTVVDQELRGAIIMCEKLTQKPDGSFVSYIAIELSGEEVAQAYNERLAKDERIMAEYNYENFKETFEAEMNKLH